MTSISCIYLPITSVAYNVFGCVDLSGSVCYMLFIYFWFVCAICTSICDIQLLFAYTCVLVVLLLCLLLLWLCWHLGILKVSAVSYMCFHYVTSLLVLSFLYWPDDWYCLN